jgi:hypothetical protein
MFETTAETADEYEERMFPAELTSTLTLLPADETIE